MSRKHSRAYEFLDKAERSLRTIADLVDWVKGGGIERTREQISEIVQALRGLAGEEKDPFRILGVDPEASREEVEEVYRAKAKFAHPDAGGSGERMALLNWARDEIYRMKGWR